MIAGDLRCVEAERAMKEEEGNNYEDEDDDSGLELSLGLAIGGGRRSSSSYVERSVVVSKMATSFRDPPCGAEPVVVAATKEVPPRTASAFAPTTSTLGRTVSGPPGLALELEVQRRREMHAIKRQEARRKLEVKQIRKAGVGARGKGGGSSSVGGGAALWRTCSVDDRVVTEMQEQRTRQRDREAREAADGNQEHKQRKGDAASADRRRFHPGGTASSGGGGCAGGTHAPQPAASNSRSGSSTPYEIPPEKTDTNTTTKTHNQHVPSTPNPVFPFPPVMPMPYALHPAQYVHLAPATPVTGGLGFPYLLQPCWNSTPSQPQTPASAPPARAVPGEGDVVANRSGIPVAPSARGSSFRPFRHASGNLAGVWAAAAAGDEQGGTEFSAAKPRSAGNNKSTGGVINRVHSLSASQGSSFSTISEYQSDRDLPPENLQGGRSVTSDDDTTTAQPDSGTEHDEHPSAAAAASSGGAPARPPSSSQSTSPQAVRSDHSVVSSNPTTVNINGTYQPVLSTVVVAAAEDDDEKSPQHGTPRGSAVTTTTTGANDTRSSSSPTSPEHAAPPAAAGTTATPRPPALPTLLRGMPYVSAKGTGPNGRTVTGFLYKFDDKDKVSIVCVCHGTSFSPAEFVTHAGATDVDNPLRHIVMVEEPPNQRVMVPSA